MISIERCSLEISIHALLAESDLYASSELWSQPHFYPRSPCGERPKVTSFFTIINVNFYPRSPCGERPSALLAIHTKSRISIHALLAESDNMEMRVICAIVNFYPRSPCGERHILCFVNAQIGGFLSTLSLRRATRQNQNL